MIRPIDPGVLADLRACREAISLQSQAQNLIIKAYLAGLGVGPSEYNHIDLDAGTLATPDDEYPERDE